MPHPGVGGLRTPRKRALEIGTDPKGFDNGDNYCAQCGHPTDTGLPHSHYEEMPEQVGGSSEPANTDPFKTGY